MKLRFEVNQAEALRRGIDCPKSIVTVEVEPSKLTEKQRTLLADRMDGIDIMKLTENRKKDMYGQRIVTNLPTFESLLETVEADEKRIKEAELLRKGVPDSALKAMQDNPGRYAGGVVQTAKVVMVPSKAR